MATNDQPRPADELPPDEPLSEDEEYILNVILELYEKRYPSKDDE